ncbi:hypothetical protein [Celerinatantimonas sp. YJH-8]|uniref:hypothetical protein n=1 Tax=Celerinatantimonas sp. YJH-8 TaxID=3228714 RepID=UPI0038C934DA
MKKSLGCMAVATLMAGVLATYSADTASQEYQPNRHPNINQHARDQQTHAGKPHSDPMQHTQGTHQGNKPSHPSDQRWHTNQGASHPQNQHQSQKMGANPSHSNRPGAHYVVNDHNKHVMKQHYQRILGRVDRHRRPTFHQGQPIPSRYRHYITPAPTSLTRQLPNLPQGYDMGYYQGYTVVYDPKTFVIVSLVDLLMN